VRMKTLQTTQGECHCNRDKGIQGLEPGCTQGHVLVVCQCYRHYDWAHTRCSHSSRSMVELGADVLDKYKGKEAAAKAKAAHFGEEKHVYQ